MAAFAAGERLAAEPTEHRIDARAGAVTMAPDLRRRIEVGERSRRPRSSSDATISALPPRP